MQKEETFVYPASPEGKKNYRLVPGFICVTWGVLSTYTRGYGISWLRSYKYNIYYRGAV